MKTSLLWRQEDSTVGIMADDLGAGVYARALLHLASWGLGR
jgi:phosphatidylglycerophosphatase A